MEVRGHPRAGQRSGERRPEGALRRARRARRRRRADASTPRGRRPTGRPDVTIAVLDSGIKWNDARRDERPADEGAPEQGRAADAEHGGAALEPGVQLQRLRDAVRRQRRRRLQRRSTTRATRASTSTTRAASGPTDVARPAGPDHRVLATAPTTTATASPTTSPAGTSSTTTTTPTTTSSTATAPARRGTRAPRRTTAARPARCPNCMVVPLRVGDSFVADVNNFAQAAIYAVDNGVLVDPGGARHAEQLARSRARRSTTPTTTAWR